MVHEALAGYFRGLLPEDFPTVQEELNWRWRTRAEFEDPDTRIGVGDRFRLSPLQPLQGIPMHKNDHVKLICPYSGSLTIEFDTGPSRLAAEEMLLIPPGTAFGVAPCRTGDFAVQLSIHRKLLEDLPGAEELSAITGSLSEAPGAGSGEARCRRFRTARSSMAQWYLDEMCCEHFDPDRHTYMMVPHLLPLLLASLDRCGGGAGRERAGSRRVTVEEIRRYVKTNYAAATLHSAARRFGFSPNYLSHLLHEATGMGFQELKQSVAVAQSARLLRETDLTVVQIAQSVGVRNTTHFYRLFADSYGMTPGQYRLAYQAE